MSVLTDVVGVTAGALMTVTSVPQVLRIWRTKDTAGVSRVTYGVWVCCAFYWCVWSVSVRAWPSFYANAAAILLDLTVMLMVRPGVVFSLGVLSGCLSGLAVSGSLTAVLLCATFLQLVATVPTVLIAVRRSPSTGVSLWSWGALFTSSVLWVFYMLAIGEHAAAFVDVVVGFFVAVIIVRVSTERRAKKTPCITKC